MVFDTEATAAALKPASPTVGSSVITPPPAADTQLRTAVQFSGIFSMTLQPGTDFGPRYRIESLLGEGGMGTVYKAVDKELGRTVALKLMRPEFAANPAAMARFRQELLLASKISHKNILRIHDLGDAGGMKFISMAYVEGNDLGKLLEAGRLPLDRFLSFARQLCSALDAAHSEDVVHRDLKPNNILIDKAGNLFVMDFGLAKSIEAEATMMTRTGQILGTPRYMAPEQVEAKALDHRADIYSLGLIFYEMAAGEIPFKADSAMQLMYQRVMQKPQDVKQVNPEVPDYLARIIMRCLEKDPDLRYQSAREILADIDAQHGPAPTVVGDRTISIQLPRPTRRSWMKVAGAVVLAIALLLAIPATRQRIWRTGTSKTASRAGIQHYLAVLPLRVADGDKDQYLADGMADSISAKLSGLGDVYVASSGAVTNALNRKDPAKIAHALGVTLLVQGTVQSSADRIAVNISLDDVGTNGRNLFHQQFEGFRDDLLTLEDRVFNALVAAMAIKQSNEELARSSSRPTENIGAYDLYLKGQNALRAGKSPGAATSAIKLFEQATQMDPRFALAYAGLADAQMRMWDQTRDGVWTQKALGAAQQAEALNDNLPEVHFSVGTADTATGRTAEAIAELRRALQLAPNSDEALRRLGNAYTKAGQMQEAIAVYLKATEINPNYWSNYNFLGGAYAALGQNDKALAAFRRITELEPDRATGWANMGVIYKQQSRWNDSIVMFNKAIALAPTQALYYSNLGAAYLVLGQYNEAAPMFEKAVELAPNEVLYQRNLADAYRFSGQTAKAMAAYDKAIALAFNAYRVTPRNATNLGQLAICYAKKGDDKQATKFIADARAIDQADNGLMYKEAVIHALAGRTQPALASLTAALQKGYSRQEARSDLDLKSLRDTPEFKKLVEEPAPN